jgi:ABC-type multidrug transport system permease subunit
MDSARRKADNIVRVFQIGLIIVFALLTILAIYFQITDSKSVVLWFVAAFLAVPGVLGFADLVGVKWVHRWFDRLRGWLVDVIVS